MRLVMTEKPIRRYKLTVDNIKTLEDVKKILDLLDLRIQTDNPDYEKVKEYFKLEVVPRGYLKLLDEVGHDGIAKMNWDEIEREASKFIENKE